MRVVKTTKQETYLRCPGCKTLLAYTDDDVLYDTKFKTDIILEERSSIRCIVCGDLFVLGYKDIKLKEGIIE